ncbi:YecA family protein [Paenibacillus pinistramenti]|uniref:YecA family protein n=1 Tax=Paenibacillus pinistramenti TaxID=1768003 RepID=UPI0011081F3A|nr:SEC-C metal-binding domain-containing protein [Paenibacillus pinistramenti]
MLTDIQSLSEQLTKEYVIKGTVVTGLTGLLSILNKTRLSALASAYEVAGRSKMKKEQLVEALAAQMTDPAYVRSVLLLAEEPEWKLFERLLKKPVLEDKGVGFGECGFLLEFGLVFAIQEDQKPFLILPDEVKAAYGKLNKADFRKQQARLWLIHDYAAALSNLYGAYKADTLIKVFNAQNEEAPLTEEELSTALDHLLLREQMFTVHGEYIVNLALEPEESEEDLNGLLELRGSKPFYVPERSELLKYKDDLYFEMTPELVKLRDHVMKEYQLEKAAADAFVDDVQLDCAVESSFGEILEGLEKFGIQPGSKEQLAELTGLVQDVYNHTRMWSNGGHTPAELSRRQKPGVIKAAHTTHYFPKKKQQVTVTKVGRNDPCPCGSGQKYKKCCGK